MVVVVETTRENGDQNQEMVEDIGLEVELDEQDLSDSVECNLDCARDAPPDEIDEVSPSTLLKEPENKQEEKAIIEVTEEVRNESEKCQIEYDSDGASPESCNKKNVSKDDVDICKSNENILQKEDAEIVEVPVEDEVTEVDYDVNPTLLYRLIESQGWTKVISQVQQHPEEAKIWVFRYSNNNNPKKKIRWRLLPIHGAIIFHAPESVVKALIDAYPMGARMVDDRKMTPLHLAFRNEASELVMNKLISVYPEGVFAKDSKGREPVQLQSLNVQKVIKSPSKVIKSTASNDTQEKSASNYLRMYFTSLSNDLRKKIEENQMLKTQLTEKSNNEVEEKVLDEKDKKIEHLENMVHEQQTEMEDLKSLHSETLGKLEQMTELQEKQRKHESQNKAMNHDKILKKEEEISLLQSKVSEMQAHSESIKSKYQTETNGLRETISTLKKASSLFEEEKATLLSSYESLVNDFNMVKSQMEKNIGIYRSKADAAERATKIANEEKETLLLKGEEERSRIIEEQNLEIKKLTEELHQERQNLIKLTKEKSDVQKRHQELHELHKKEYLKHNELRKEFDDFKEESIKTNDAKDDEINILKQERGEAYKIMTRCCNKFLKEKTMRKEICDSSEENQDVIQSTASENLQEMFPSNFCWSSLSSLPDKISGLMELSKGHEQNINDLLKTIADLQKDSSSSKVELESRVSQLLKENEAIPQLQMVKERYEKLLDGIQKKVQEEVEELANYGCDVKVVGDMQQETMRSSVNTTSVELDKIDGILLSYKYFVRDYERDVEELKFFLKDQKELSFLSSPESEKNGVDHRTTMTKIKKLIYHYKNKLEGSGEQLVEMDKVLDEAMNNNNKIKPFTGDEGVLDDEMEEDGKSIKSNNRYLKSNSANVGTLFSSSKVINTIQAVNVKEKLLLYVQRNHKLSCEMELKFKENLHKFSEMNSKLKTAKRLYYEYRDQNKEVEAELLEKRVHIQNLEGIIDSREVKYKVQREKMDDLTKSVMHRQAEVDNHRIERQSRSSIQFPFQSSNYNSARSSSRLRNNYDTLYEEDLTFDGIINSQNTITPKAGSSSMNNVRYNNKGLESDRFFSDDEGAFGHGPSALLNTTTMSTVTNNNNHSNNGNKSSIFRRRNHPASSRADYRESFPSGRNVNHSQGHRLSRRGDSVSNHLSSSPADREGISRSELFSLKQEQRRQRRRAAPDGMRFDNGDFTHNTPSYGAEALFYEPATAFNNSKYLSHQTPHHLSRKNNLLSSRKVANGGASVCSSLSGTYDNRAASRSIMQRNAQQQQHKIHEIHVDKTIWEKEDEYHVP